MVLGRFLRKQQAQESTSVDTDGLGGFGSVEDLNATADPRAAAVSEQTTTQEDAAAVFKRRRKRPVAVQNESDGDSSSSSSEVDEEENDENVSIGESVDTEIDEDFQNAINDDKKPTSSELSSHFDAANKKKSAAAGASACSSDDDLTVDTNAVKSMVASDLFGDFRAKINEPPPDDKKNDNDASSSSEDEEEEPPPTSSWGRGWFGRKQQQPSQEDLEAKDDPTTKVESNNNDAATASAAEEEDSDKADTTSSKRGGGWFATRKKDESVNVNGDLSDEQLSEEKTSVATDQVVSEIGNTSNMEQEAAANDESQITQPITRRLGWFNRRSDSQAEEEPSDAKDTPAAEDVNDDASDSLVEDHSSESNSDIERSETCVLDRPAPAGSIGAAPEDARSLDDSSDNDVSVSSGCSGGSQNSSISTRENSGAVVEASEPVEKKRGMGWFGGKEEQAVDSTEEDLCMPEAATEPLVDESCESIDSDDRLIQKPAESESTDAEVAQSGGISQAPVALSRLGWFNRRSNSQDDNVPSTTNEVNEATSEGPGDDHSSQSHLNDKRSETSDSMGSLHSDSESAAAEENASISNSSFDSSNRLDVKEGDSEHVSDCDEHSVQEKVVQKEETLSPNVQPRQRLGWFNRRSESQEEDKPSMVEVSAAEVDDLGSDNYVEEDCPQRISDDGRSESSDSAESADFFSKDDVSVGKSIDSGPQLGAKVVISENVTNFNERSVQEEVGQNEETQSPNVQPRQRLGWFNPRNESREDKSSESNVTAAELNGVSIDASEDQSQSHSDDGRSENSDSIGSANSILEDEVSICESFDSGSQLEPEGAESGNVSNFDDNLIQQEGMENETSHPPIAQSRERLDWFNRRIEDNATTDEPADRRASNDVLFGGDNFSESIPEDERSETSDVNPSLDIDSHSEERPVDGSESDNDESFSSHCSQVSKHASISSAGDNDNAAAVQASEQVVEKKRGMGWFQSKKELPDSSDQDPQTSVLSIDESNTEEEDFDPKLEAKEPETENVGNSDGQFSQQDTAQQVESDSGSLPWFKPSGKGESVDEPFAQNEPIDDDVRSDVSEEEEEEGSFRSEASDASYARDGGWKNSSSEIDVSAEAEKRRDTRAIEDLPDFSNDKDFDSRTGLSDESCGSDRCNSSKASSSCTPDENSDTVAKRPEAGDTERGKGWFRSKKEESIHTADDDAHESAHSTDQTSPNYNSTYQLRTENSKSEIEESSADKDVEEENGTASYNSEMDHSECSKASYITDSPAIDSHRAASVDDISVCDSYDNDAHSLEDVSDNGGSCASTAMAEAISQEQPSVEPTSYDNTKIDDETESENSDLVSRESESQSYGDQSESDNSISSDISANRMQTTQDSTFKESAYEKPEKELSQDTRRREIIPGTFGDKNTSSTDMAELGSDAEESQYSDSYSESQSDRGSQKSEESFNSGDSEDISRHYTNSDDSNADRSAKNTADFNQFSTAQDSTLLDKSPPHPSKEDLTKSRDVVKRHEATAKTGAATDSDSSHGDHDKVQSSRDSAADKNGENTSAKGSADDETNAENHNNSEKPSSDEDEDIKRAMAMALAMKNNPNMTPAEIQQLVSGGGAVVTTRKTTEKTQPRRRWGWFGGGRGDSDKANDTEKEQSLQKGNDAQTFKKKESHEKSPDSATSTAKPSDPTPTLSSSKPSNDMRSNTQAKQSEASNSDDIALRTTSVKDTEKLHDGDQPSHEDESPVSNDNGATSAISESNEVSQSASASSSELSDDQSHSSGSDTGSVDEDFPNTESKDGSGTCSRDERTSVGDQPVSETPRQSSSDSHGLDIAAQNRELDTDATETSAIQKDGKTPRRSKDKRKKAPQNSLSSDSEMVTTTVSPCIDQKTAEERQTSEETVAPVIPPRNYGNLAIARALIQQQNAESDEDPVSSSEDSEYESESDSDEDVDNGKRRPFRLVVREAPLLRLENVTANTRNNMPEKDMRKKKAWGWGFGRKAGGKGDTGIDTDDEDDKKETEEMDGKADPESLTFQASKAEIEEAATTDELAVKSKKKTKKKKKKQKVGIGAHLEKSVRRVTRHGDEVSVGTMNFTNKQSNRELIINEAAPDFEVSEDGGKSHPWAKKKSARKGPRRFSAIHNKSTLKSFTEEEEEDLKKIETFDSKEEFFREAVTDAKQNAKSTELASVIESNNESECEDETNSDKDVKQSQPRQEEETGAHQEHEKEEEEEEDDGLGHLLTLTELEDKLSGDDVPDVDFDDMWDEASCDMSIVLEFERTKRKKNHEREKKRLKREQEKEEKANAARRLRLFEKNKEQGGKHDKKAKNSKLSDEFIEAIHKVFDDGSDNSQDSVSDSNSDIDDAVDDTSADGSAASLYLHTRKDENDESTELDDSQGLDNMNDSTDDFEASFGADHKSRASKSRRSKASHRRSDSASKARSSKAASKRKKLKRSTRAEVDASDIFIAELEKLKKPKALTIQGLRQEMVDRRGTSVNLLKKEYVTFKKKRKSVTEDELHQIDFETLGRNGGVNAVKYGRESQDIFSSPKQEEEHNEKRDKDGLGAMISRWATEEGITELDDLATVAAPQNAAPNLFGATAGTATNVAKTAASTAAARKPTNQDLNDLARGAGQGLKTAGGNVQNAGINLGRNLNQAGRTAGRNIGSGISAVGSGIEQGFGSSGIGPITSSVGKQASKILPTVPERNDDDMNMFTANFSDAPLSSIQETDDDDDFGLLASHQRDDSEDDDNFSYSSARSKRSYTKSNSGKFNLGKMGKAPKIGMKIKKLGLKIPSLPKAGGARGKNSNGFSLNENSSDFY